MFESSAADNSSDSRESSSPVQGRTGADTQGRKQRSVLDAVPTLALPKGGGAIRSIGEKFGVNSATGTASFSIPLPFSPGRGGATPDLSLAYESGAGAGIFGWGWRLGLPAISRRTDRGLPRYLGDDEPDTFIGSGGEDFVPLVKGDGSPELTPDPLFVIHRYAPRIEGAFARIERWVHGQTGDTHWRVISPGNVTTVFGPTEATRIADTDNASRIFSWLAAEVFDDKGNRTLFEYKREDRDGIAENGAHEANRLGWLNPQLHPKRIKYGNVRPKGQAGDDRFLFELVLDYGEHAGEHPLRTETATWPARPDPISVRRPGFELRTYRLCERMLMFHRFPEGIDGDAKLVRSLALDYRRSAVACLITGARLSGYAEMDDGRTVVEQMPALAFEYQLAPESLETPPLALDLEDLDELPAGLADAGVQWVDIDGEGLAGVLLEGADRWAFKPNLSPLDTLPSGVTTARLGGLRTLAAAPVGGLAAGGHFVDLEGDGLPDLVHFEGAVPGFSGRDESGGWIARRPFRSLPNIDWASPDMRFLDLTGDGLPDLVIGADDRLLWYQALGQQGYADPQTSRLATDEDKGPFMVFRDRDETIFLADMSGDGLTDIVRIRAREVVYWPNLGYGRFGPKVTMSDAPDLGAEDVFDPTRLRLADTDGSGTTDLVYLGAAGWSVYVNCAGNLFAPALVWSTAPPFDTLAQVDTFDLLGNGTACLVWSTRLPIDGGRQIRHLPLAGGRKPYLLTSVKNGLGLETQIRYAPSTAFQLRDRMAGTPWATRLPFPVQVVERVEAHDHISDHRFTTRYLYHQGYYDGREREFRGFGFVEQWDTESWSNVSREPGSNEDAASEIPPVRTLRWFHTGMPSPGADMSRLYERDYFGAPGGPGAVDPVAGDLFRRTRITDADIPLGMAADDHRDVCRALKGSLLREEIYSNDETSRARLPYKISVAGYATELRQAADTHRPAIVFVHPRETLDVHLERDLAAPRVSQSFVLKVGRFGDVLERVEVSHGGPAPPFPGPGAAAIALPRAFIDEADVTINIDQPGAWHAPLPAETRRFALVGAGLQTPWPIAASVVRGLAAAATPLQPTDATDPTAAPSGKKLLARVRNLYRRDDLTGPLAFLDLEPKAVPFETYALAFTPALVARTYGDRIAAGIATTEAGYVDLEGNGSLWATSGRSYFQRTKDHPDEATTAADRGARAAAERSEAESHFYLPRAARDPFGGHVFVDHDALDLFPIAVEDRVGNIARATYDTRTLQPSVVVDPNGNRAFAAFDTLALVASSAIAGKQAAVEGDLLPPSDSFLTPVDIDALLIALADPASQQARAAELLGTATTRTLTDVHRFARAGKATVTVTLSRETHVSDLRAGVASRIAIAVAHSDGTGRIVQAKVLTEPGPLAPGGPVLPVRWITSGWVIHDNKGNPVRSYEPFHSGSPEYEPNHQAGVSRIVFRDPLSRVVGALNPDGSIEKTRFTPWFQKTWDANDTVLIVDHAADPDIGSYVGRLDPIDRSVPWHTQRVDGAKGETARKAAVATEAHSETPAEVYLDALGRTTLAIENAGAAGKLVTAILLDDDGSEREVIDARQRLVARYDHDLLGRRTFQSSMEAGTRRIFPCADGLALFGWDDRGHIAHHGYDIARRPVEVAITDATGSHVRERLIYGEGLGAALNHRGRVHQVFDGAGLVTTRAYDFKGAPVVVERRFVKDPRGRPNWATDPEQVLESETFTARTRNDAVGRPIQTMSPVSNRPGAPTSVVQPIYDESGKLDVVDLWLDVAAPPESLLAPPTATKRVIRGIDHDAKGRRTAIRYGNGAETTCSYDPETFRLAAILTVRGPGFAVDRPGEAQNLSYTYDPVGNVTEIADSAQQTIYFRGQVVTPTSRFAYDPLYRLTSAEGREHRGLDAHTWPSWNDQERRGDHPEDASAMRNYTQRYLYDEVGNINEVQHVADAGSWTRAYSYLESSLLEPGQHSNRLTRTVVGDETEAFSYDVHGSITRTTHLASMTYDDVDRFASADLGGGGRVDYQYDASGQRMRKVVERHGAGGVVSGFEERLYLGGFEIFRVKDRNGSVLRERETLHVADGAKTVLDVETRTRGSAADDPAPARLFRFQFDNHLGSACLELDAAGAIISYEEYHPYGSTSLQTVRSRTETPKRYRYTGKERDDETGFTYHGARYYAPWLGRWSSCDSESSKGEQLNLYRYCKNSPPNHTDDAGRDPVPTNVAQMTQEELNQRYALSSADQEAITLKTYGVSGAELADYLGPGTKGDVMDKYGVGGYVRIRDAARALPIEILMKYSPPTDRTVYLQASGRQATNEQERATRVQQVSPGTPLGSVGYAAARTLGVSHNNAQIVAAVGDLVESGLPAHYPTATVVGGRASAAPGRAPTYERRTGAYQEPAPRMGGLGPQPLANNSQENLPRRIEGGEVKTLASADDARRIALSDWAANAKDTQYVAAATYDAHGNITLEIFLAGGNQDLVWHNDNIGHVDAADLPRAAYQSGKFGTDIEPHVVRYVGQYLGQYFDVKHGNTTGSDFVPASQKLRFNLLRQGK